MWAQIALLLAAPAIGQPGNVVVDGDFNRPGMELSGAWSAIIHGESDAKIAIVEGVGRDGSTCAEYRRADEGSDNIHLDQIIPTEPGAVYEVRAWIRGDGQLKPVLSITDMEWQPIVNLVAEGSADWVEVRSVLDAGRNSQLRLEWFPGAAGRLYTGGPGQSALDDVSVTRVDPVDPRLREALDLVTDESDAEVDVTRVEPGPVGPPLPLRAIRCHGGALVYEDGTEVALWGVNLQTALSWEYRARMAPCDIPLEAEVLKRIADTNLEELRRMGVGSVRMHLLPSDFSGADGELQDSIYLDVLDYTVARCREIGIYVYLTLLNEMGAHHIPDSFIAGSEREEWLVDESIIESTERYIGELLSHVNRYSGVAYCDDDAIGVIEIMNEPGYIDYNEMMTDERFADLRETFDSWREGEALDDYPELLYARFRYGYVKAYINRMRAVVRAAGARQPVCWNLNWPRMIASHEDVFQAAADSDVEAVSFCLYPGQDDVKSPFWANPVDLSDTNYLPFMRRNYEEYRRLRWLLGERFAGKAKCVYEFETFYNQTSYLYPAMARLLRALGAQVANMWTYSLTPTAEFISGSHHLNLHCTPEKAVSFAIAGQVFADTPRLAPYEAPDDSEATFGDCTVSFSRNLSVHSSPSALMHSRALDWDGIEVHDSVSRIVGCGDSPLVTYDGTGAYFIDVGEDSISLTIGPDARFILPPWDRQKSKPWARTCELDRDSEHSLALRLPGWEEGARAVRVDDGEESPVAVSGPGLALRVRP
ncbi:MAG TPA: hypothetical protein QGH10_03930, partial [Armatimonadota bacterium]|nr:hypothetical protein [Armatimonadota bacterium]